MEAEEIAAKLQGLVGQRLLAVEVVPLGVFFQFERAVYWAYGGPAHREVESEHGRLHDHQLV